MRRRAVHNALRTLGPALLTAAALPLQGCALVGLPAVMMESYKRTSTYEVKAEYTGLQGKTFAVVIGADRVIQSDRPALIPGLTVAVSERLREHSGAAGYVPPSVMIDFMTNNPRWVAMSHKELAEELDVDRLIYVDLIEFRLNEPGNAILWEGVAAASVGVLEIDGPISDEFIFRKQVMVDFPDEKGVSVAEFPADYVQARLQTRLVDRITWLFYDHQEPYYPDY